LVPPIFGCGLDGGRWKFRTELDSGVPGEKIFRIFVTPTSEQCMPGMSPRDFPEPTANNKYQKKKNMKSIEMFISIAAALVMAGPANAQSTAPYSGIYEQAEAPKTTRMRVADLKARHEQARTELSTALGRISTDPTQVTSAETFAAIDKADRDMRRSIAASDSIQAAIRAEMTTIKSDSAFSDEQKAELETAAKTMVDECSAVRTEAGAVIKNLAKSYKLQGVWLEGSWEGAGDEDEIDGELLALLIIRDQ
jgi:hypothetical protein